MLYPYLVSTFSEATQSDWGLFVLWSLGSALVCHQIKTSVSVHQRFDTRMNSSKLVSLLGTAPTSWVSRGRFFFFQEDPQRQFIFAALISELVKGKKDLAVTGGRSWTLLGYIKTTHYVSLLR